MDLTCLLSCLLYYSDVHFILISWYAWIKCNQCFLFPYYYRDIIMIKSYQPTNIVILVLFLYRGNTCWYLLLCMHTVCIRTYVPMYGVVDVLYLHTYLYLGATYPYVCM